MIPNTYLAKKPSSADINKIATSIDQVICGIAGYLTPDGADSLDLPAIYKNRAEIIIHISELVLTESINRNSSDFVVASVNSVLTVVSGSITSEMDDAQYQAVVKNSFDAMEVLEQTWAAQQLLYSSLPV